MTTNKVCLLNGIILIALGFWGYAANHFALHTGLAPLGFGAYLVLVSKWQSLENRMLFFITAGLTIGFLIAMTQPLLRNLEQSDLVAACRVVLEIAACVMAVIIYIRSIKHIKLYD